MLTTMLALFVEYAKLPEVLVSTLIFVVIGLIFFVIAFFVLEKGLPYSVHKEIEEDQNVALGIIIGSLLIGIAIIISAAISG